MNVIDILFYIHTCKSGFGLNYDMNLNTFRMNTLIGILAN